MPRWEYPYNFNLSFSCNISFFRGLDFQNFDIWISKGIFPQLLPSFSRNIVIHWISRTKVDFAFVERQTTLTGAWKCLQFDILAAESTSLQLGTSNFLSLSETNIGVDLKQILIQRGAKIHKPCIPPFRKQGAQMDKVKQAKLKSCDIVLFTNHHWSFGILKQPFHSLKNTHDFIFPA